MTSLEEKIQQKSLKRCDVSTERFPEKTECWKLCKEYRAYSTNIGISCKFFTPDGYCNHWNPKIGFPLRTVKISHVLNCIGEVADKIRELDSMTLSPMSYNEWIEKKKVLALLVGNDRAKPEEKELKNCFKQQKKPAEKMSMIDKKKETEKQ